MFFLVTKTKPQQTKQKEKTMNKMLLTSTLALSLIVIKAAKNGMSNNQIVELSTLSLLRANKNVTKEVERDLTNAAKAASLTENEIVALISTQGLTYSQVYYAMKKDKLDRKTKKVKAAKASLSKTVRGKKLTFSFGALKIAPFQAYSYAK